MSAREAALLLCWLSCGVLALWRYSISSSDYSILSTRNTINLIFEGDQFSLWSFSRKSCTLKDQTSPVAEIRCHTEDAHFIEPLGQGNTSLQEGRYLNVGISHICFMWYYTVVNDFENLTQVVTIWVYDPESASKAELDGTAKIPSLNSRILTKQLYSLGQQPFIFTVVKRRMYASRALSRQGTWTIRVPMTSDDLMKVIRGTQVAFQDCFIANLFFLLSFPMMTIPETPGEVPLTLPAGKQLMATWSACIPTFAILVSDQETFQSNDSFATWTRVRIPEGVLSDDERHNVASVALFNNGILFLINGAVYLKTSESFKKLDSSKGLPETGIIGMTDKRKSMVAVWTRNELYLGYSSFRFMRTMDISTLKDSLKFGPSDTLGIETVEYTWHPLELALLLYHCTSCATVKSILLVIINEDSGQLLFQDFKLELPMDSNVFSHFLNSALPDLILWNAEKIYYCNKNFTDCGVSETSDGESSLSQLSEGSTIHNVLIDRHGNIVVKMENNALFFLKVGISEIVKLPQWVNTVTKTSLFLDKSLRLYLLYFSDDSQITTEAYPLYLEVKSILHHKKERCPYISFKHNIYSQFYFIDKGDSLTIWSQIVYPENRGLNIIVEHYGPNLLTWTQSVTFEISWELCTKTMLTTFSQETNYELVDDYYELQKKKMGLMLIQFRPSEYAKVCPKGKQVFEVAVGCNINKHIRVKGFSRTGCQRRDFSYVIDKEYLRDKPSESMKIRYDVARYGCPRRIEFNRKFHPILELFDENGFVKIVEANFILWEIHGRKDYSYNYTMKQSGCVNIAQTWKSMIELNKGVPLEDVWGPHNYKTCFSFAIGNPGDLSQPYEIINSTNNNYIYWPVDHSGMYVFRVKILDPNFSFCNLTALFAIETFGSIPRPSFYLVASFLFVLMLTFISILVMSYFWYMKIYRQFIYEPLNKPPSKKKDKEN